MIDSLRFLKDEGIFEGRHFFLKPLELARNERLDLTQIPSNPQEFETYIEEHLKKKDLSVPYVLNEFVQGQEYAANVICKNGIIYMIHVCPSSPIQTNYISMSHQPIENWVKKFIKTTNLSGLVCFDFLVTQENIAYCIECNPRLHSAIVSFQTPQSIDDLTNAIEAAMNDEQASEPLTLTNYTEVYWFFQEVEKVLTRETSLDRFLDLIQNGKDAVWQVDDPLPFFILNFVQIPLLLIVATLKGNAWSKVNFCLGQVL